MRVYIANPLPFVHTVAMKLRCFGPITCIAASALGVGPCSPTPQVATAHHQVQSDYLPPLQKRAHGQALLNKAVTTTQTGFNHTWIYERYNFSLRPLTDTYYMKSVNATCRDVIYTWHQGTSRHYARPGHYTVLCKNVFSGDWMPFTIKALDAHYEQTTPGIKTNNNYR